MDDKERIKELEKEVQHLKSLAFKDELTGLYNRHGFKDSAGKFLAEIESEKEHQENRKSVFIKDFSLVVFDIDNFKKLNDTYGHQAGDEALKIFSDIVHENVRDIDSAARWGGEEIVIGLVGANVNDAFTVADRIRESIEKNKFTFEGQEIKFTVSGGIASSKDSPNFEEMFNLADKALYQAKTTGKNQIIKAEDLK